MKKRDVEKQLKKLGFEPSHDVWGNGTVTIPVPRYKGDLNIHTATDIIRVAKGEKAQ